MAAPTRADLILNHRLRHRDRYGHLASVFDFHRTVGDCHPTCCCRRRSEGAVAPDHWLTRKENYQKLWDGYKNANDTLMLKTIDIESDGGLRDEKIRQLWPDREDTVALVSRWARAISVIVAGFASIAFVFVFDIAAIVWIPDQVQPNKFLFLGTLCNWLLPPHATHCGEPVVGIIELTLLCLEVCKCIFLAYRFSRSKLPGEKWQAGTCLFLGNIPFVASFTAMKLLHFVDPAVFVSDVALQLSICVESLKHKKYVSGISELCWFLISRIVFFSVGYDSFLIKLRMNVNAYVNKADLSFFEFMSSLMFLFQVLGVINLNAFVRGRLFNFVFGGPDCVVDSQDKAREWFWNALLAKKIWDQHGSIKFYIIMLSCSDNDFQQLVLSDSSKQSASKLPCTDRGLDSACYIKDHRASLINQFHNLEKDVVAGVKGNSVESVEQLRAVRPNRKIARKSRRESRSPLSNNIVDDEYGELSAVTLGGQVGCEDHCDTRERKGSRLSSDSNLIGKQNSVSVADTGGVLMADTIGGTTDSQSHCDTRERQDSRLSSDSNMIGNQNSVSVADTGRVLLADTVGGPIDSQNHCDSRERQGSRLSSGSNMFGKQNSRSIADTHGVHLADTIDGPICSLRNSEARKREESRSRLLSDADMSNRQPLEKLLS